MGRKKTSLQKKPAFVPFCFYCERAFDTNEILIQHQRLKHFRCSLCSRKPETASGLVIHMLQVHKASLGTVPNALPGKDSPDLKIVGMRGVPTAVILERARGTDLEDYISRSEVHLHPVFADVVTSNVQANSEEYPPSSDNLPHTTPVNLKEHATVALTVSKPLARAASDEPDNKSPPLKVRKIE